MNIRSAPGRGIFFIIVCLITVFVFTETTQTIFFASHDAVVVENQYHLLLITIFAGVGDFSLFGIFSLMISIYIIYMLGQIAEALFGEVKLVLIYIISALVASLAALFLFRDNVSMGFSLGVLGLVGGVLGHMKSTGESNMAVNHTLIFTCIIMIARIMGSGISLMAYVIAVSTGALIGYVGNKK